MFLFPLKTLACKGLDSEVWENICEDIKYIKQTLFFATTSDILILVQKNKYVSYTP